MSEIERVILFVGGGHANVQVIRGLESKRRRINGEEEKFKFILISDSIGSTYSGMIPEGDLSLARIHLIHS